MIFPSGALLQSSPPRHRPLLRKQGCWPRHRAMGMLGATSRGQQTEDNSHPWSKTGRKSSGVCTLRERRHRGGYALSSNLPPSRHGTAGRAERGGVTPLPPASGREAEMKRGHCFSLFQIRKSFVTVGRGGCRVGLYRGSVSLSTRPGEQMCVLSGAQRNPLNTCSRRVPRPLSPRRRGGRKSQ